MVLGKPAKEGESPVSEKTVSYTHLGKICPNPYVYNTSAHTWDEFKRKISGQAKTPQGGNEKTIWNFLTGKGLNAHAVEMCIRDSSRGQLK